MRIIDADKTIREMNDYAMNSGLLVNPMDMMEIIENQPTINVETVVYGEWLKIGKTDDGDSINRCSNCHREVNGDIPYYFQYCHKCGTKMDKEKI